MKSQEIQKHIDRAVGTEGILRIPSWWMHKILSDIVLYCEENKGGDTSELKSYVDSQIKALSSSIDDIDCRVEELESHEMFAIVGELPTEPKDNTIYLVPSPNGEDHNVLTEWVHINGSWEQFGEFKVDIDLSEYAKKDDIHTPDWNAGEGEEGHILNRTHYADFVEVDIPEDIASSEVEVTIPHIVGVPILVHYRGYVTSKYLKISPDDHELHVFSYGPAFKIRRGYDNNIFISGHNNENHRLYIATHFVELNEVFLPETIARKSEMATINGQPLTEGGDIVIEGGGGSYDDTEIQNKLTELSAVIGLEGVNNIDLSNANSGYIFKDSGNITPDNYYNYSNPIQVKRGQILILVARVANSVAAISWTDANATYRTPVVIGDGSANPTEYRYLVENDGYVIVCFYKGVTHSASLINATIYNLFLETSEKIDSTNAELSKLSKAYIEDDLISSATNATKQGVQTIQGTYGKDSAKYKVDASAFGNTTGVCHIAFDFKINEDVNIGEVVEKSFFRIEKDTWYADFVLKCGATSIFEGKEAKGSHTLTTTRSGMPYFNSCFGTRSNWQTGGDRLNLFMDTRSFHYDDNNKSHCYKPLCGKDLFSIQLIAVDSNGNELNTLSQEAQIIYQNWQDAYVEVTSTAVNVVSQTNAINETFAYANFSTMTALFAAIYTKLHNKIGNGVKWSVTDIGTSYYASETPNLVKCKIYLSSEHPSSNNSTFYDAFPAYLSHAIDDSWHTFELVSRADQDTMYFCIDGQYYGNADSRNWSIDTIRYIFKNATLIFGGELNVTFRNLLIESDSYQHAEVGKGVHYIISKRNPYILCLFLHEMYYAPNVGGDFSSYMTFESGGGKIPDSLKNPNANYVGDDYIQESRKTVTFPSWSIEDVISRLHDKGYMCISKKDLPKVMSGEICNPKNRYYIMDIDDHQTYIYDREDCRNIFTRYNCRPCFANELGFYLTKEISDELAGYDVANFIESYCKDTNEHRLALQKRLQSLLHSGWTLDIHGSKEGYTFQGKTYQQMKAEILNAINISKFYGLPINAWCYAANYYTPNAVKLLKSMGIEYGTSTASQPIGKCRDNGFLPRIMITTNVANNIKVII